MTHHDVGHINKPLQLRIAMGMTKAQAGHLILAIPDKHDAYTTWARIERENMDEDHLSRGHAREFKRYMQLINAGYIDLVREMFSA